MYYEADDTNLMDLMKEGFSVVDFFTETCGPCKLLAPILTRIEAELPFINLIKVNLTQHPGYHEKFDVHAVPTMLFVKNGKICETHLGVLNEEKIMAIIGQYLYE